MAKQIDLNLKATFEGRVSGHPIHNDEDDYEDMVTPTDDEGITSLNHTQKIPISLIKAKDKASVSDHDQDDLTKRDLNSNNFKGYKF